MAFKLAVAIPTTPDNPPNIEFVLDEDESHETLVK